MRHPSRLLGLALAGALALSPLAGTSLVSAQEQDLTIDEITDNPTAYFGQTVTVTGPVEDVLGPRSFTVSDADPLLTEEIPVVGGSMLTGDVQQQLADESLDGQEVTVTGTVHQFNLAAFEDQVGVDLDDSAWGEWAGQPAIVATSVRLASAQQQDDEQAEGMTPEQGAAQGTTPGQTAPTGQPGVAMASAPDMPMWTTVDRITDDPQAYYGREVTVVGEIGDVLNNRSFRIEDSDLLFDEQMLVVAPRPLMSNGGQEMRPEDLEGYQAMVRGTVQQFDIGAFEDEMGIGLTDDMFAEDEGQPALMATSIVLNPNVYGPYGVSPYAPPAVTGAPGTALPGQQYGTTVDAITDNPGAYIGNTVTIAGEIGEALGLRSFTVEDNDLLFNEEIAVLGARPLLNRDGQPYQASALDDIRVTVTGTVRTFNRADFERDMNLDLSDASLDGWENRSVIVAESIRQLP